MAEEIDPRAEGIKIVNKYLSELGWAREFKRSVVRQLIPAIEKEPKLQRGDQMEEEADGNFGREVDIWRKEGTKGSRDVLRVVFDRLRHRSDLSYFGKRMIERLKEELGE